MQRLCMYKNEELGHVKFCVPRTRSMDRLCMRMWARKDCGRTGLIHAVSEAAGIS